MPIFKTDYLQLVLVNDNKNNRMLIDTTKNQNLLLLKK